jgi:hypothetical protein
MEFSSTDLHLLKAAESCGKELPDGFSKCAIVLRNVLRMEAAWGDSAEYAVCNTGYEDAKVSKLYDGIRALIAKGFLDGRGDLTLPAGPRYTECRITTSGSQWLHKAEDETS